MTDTNQRTSAVERFSAQMIANGKAFVDFLDNGLNEAQAKRDAVLQRDAQIGILAKVHKRFRQLPDSPVRAEVLDILDAELVAVADVAGLSAEIDNILFKSGG